MDGYSVLMSVYNKEKAEYMEASVKSMLNQTVPPSDFVLVCDGPLTKELDSVIEKFEHDNPTLFQIIRLPQNKGLGEALLRGLDSCKCDIIARMDSDDVALQNRMELQLAVLENDERVSVVGGQIREFSESDARVNHCRIVPTEYEDIKKFAARRNPMNHVTVSFKKKDVLSAGGYKSLDKFEDYYLWARMIAMGFYLVNIDQICVNVRVNLSMYKRRGGWKYFRQTLKLEKYLRSVKICTAKQYVSNVIIRFCSALMVPSKIRQFIYVTALRK